MKFCRSFLAVALTVTSFAATSRAQNPPLKADFVWDSKDAPDPRRPPAEVLFATGLRLRLEHREAEALENFRKSYATYPVPNTLMEQARSEQLLERYLEAIRHYREVLKNPILDPTNVVPAKQSIAELEKRVARVSVRGRAGTSFSAFGQTFWLPLKEPLDVESGLFTVHGDWEGTLLEGSVQAITGKIVVLDLKGSTETTTNAHPPKEAARSSWDVAIMVGIPSISVGLRSIGMRAVLSGAGG